MTLAPWRRRALVATVLVLSLTLFFRDALLARFTLFYGDSYDGMIEIALLNHWYNVFAHGATWNLTGWFAPNGDTLGYNDSYILPGVIFAFARMAGSDPFMAAFFSHVAMKAIGFLGMYALLFRGFRLPLGLSLAGATLFATANASLLHMYHAQLLAVGLIPWLMLAMIGTVRAMAGDHRAAMWRNGFGFALLFGLGALNAFYQIWFLCFFTLIFVPVGLAIASPETRATLWSTASRHWRALIILTASTAVALLPFLIVYLPKAAESGGHDWATGARDYLLIASTFVNSGPGNLIWGHILPMRSFHGGEGRVGFPLGILFALLVASVWAWRNRAQVPMATATAITLGIILLMMIRWSKTISIWWVVYHFVPGAGAVRVIERFMLFALIPVIVIVFQFLNRPGARPATTWTIIAFLLIEQVQLAAPLTLDRQAQMQMLTDVGAPPASCDTFFVVSARLVTGSVASDAERTLRAWGNRQGDGMALLLRYRHNVDAMMLASYYRRPTINGFSTFNPPGWNFERPYDDNYLSRVRAYARRNPVGRLCGLDRRRSPYWFAFR
ncbi:MAG: hypothetical protein V4472_19690 [Pseudomonadota bacterium]